MKSTRRGFLTGAVALMTTPAIVRASSLDFVPRHRYYAYFHPHNAILDIVRDDGRLIGWTLPADIHTKQPNSPKELLELAREGICETTRLHAQEMFYSEDIYMRKSMSIAEAYRHFAHTETP